MGGIKRSNVMKRDYLNEYYEALDELEGYPPISDEKREILIDNMQAIADAAVDETVLKTKLTEALNEYSKFEKTKFKVGAKVFIASIVGMVGSNIVANHGVNPNLMQEITDFTQRLAIVSGGFTFAFSTVGFACKMTAELIKKDLEALKLQVGRIAYLPHNNILKRIGQEIEKE